MSPLGRRIVPVLALLVVAPVCAEYLQAYLPQTGDALVLLAGLLVLGPLYGGAALLIRETGVRTGRGWTGTLLMGAAFGLLMTSLVDGSMWQVHDPRVSYWDQMRAGTLLAPLGFAAFPVLAWVVGHAVYSIGAPLALLDALAPGHRGRPLLGRPGLVVVTVLCGGAAVLIHGDPGYDATGATPLQAVLTVVVAAGLVALALSPAGRPRRRRARATRSWWTPVRTLVLAVVTLTALDLLPATWLGLVGYAAVLAVAGWWLVRTSRGATWGLRQVTALGVAAVLERTLTGFAAPNPVGVDTGEKLLQSAVLLVLAAGVSLLAWRRAAQAPDPAPAAADATGRAAERTTGPAVRR